jgi:hypothetical protein
MRNFYGEFAGHSADRGVCRQASEHGVPRGTLLHTAARLRNLTGHDVLPLPAGTLPRKVLFTRLRMKSKLFSHTGFELFPPNQRFPMQEVQHRLNLRRPRAHGRRDCADKPIPTLQFILQPYTS